MLRLTFWGFQNGMTLKNWTIGSKVRDLLNFLWHFQFEVDQIRGVNEDLWGTILCQDSFSAGDKSVDGSTSTKTTQLLESLHFRAVLDGLKSHPSTWVPGGGPCKNFRSLIKSQIGVMAKKLKGGVVGNGVVWVPAKVHAQTPGLYQVQNWSYGQKIAKNHNF